MLAIIPARGGSKGIPGKNIRMLCGKPLIAHSIEVALACNSIDRVIVSTDDEEIAKVAREYEAEIPFMRPKELAQDNSIAIDAYLYTIERLNNEFGEQYQEFTVLLPTSPLRIPEDIDNAVELFKSKDADTVLTFAEMSHPPVWAVKIHPDGTLQNYFDIDMELKNRQELEVGYMPNGSIYVFKYSLLKDKYTIYSDKTYAYVMPPERSVDIDTEIDFKFAEFLMRSRTYVD